MKKTLLLLLVFVLLIIMAPVGVNAAQLYSGFLCEPSDTIIAVEGRIVQLERQPVSINGRILVPARSTFENLGIKTDWYPGYEVVKMVCGDASYITMSIGSRVAYTNGKIKYMEAPPVLINGLVMVPIRFVAEEFGSTVGWDAKNNLAFIGNAPELPSRGGELLPNREYKVVIDAGHGGSDPGAVYGGIYEKSLNLDIAIRLNNLLKAEGIQTHMTRNNDLAVGLYTRSGLANDIGADLFVSVHNNAGHSMYSGCMTLYHPSIQKKKGDLSSYEFAKIIQDNLVRTLGATNLGVIERPNLAVLRTTDMPAVIAEVGYMSNSSELSKLKTEEYRQKAAEALRDGVVQSLKRMY